MTKCHTFVTPSPLNRRDSTGIRIVSRQTTDIWFQKHCCCFFFLVVGISERYKLGSRKRDYIYIRDILRSNDDDDTMPSKKMKLQRKRQHEHEHEHEHEHPSEFEHQEASKPATTRLTNGVGAMHGVVNK